MEYPVGIGTVTRTESRYDPHPPRARAPRQHRSRTRCGKSPRQQAAGEKNKQYPYPPSLPGAFAARSAFFSPAVRRQRLGFPPSRPAPRRGGSRREAPRLRGRRLLTPRGLAFGLFHAPRGRLRAAPSRRCAAFSCAPAKFFWAFALWSRAFSASSSARASSSAVLSIAASFSLTAAISASSSGRRPPVR